MVVVGVVVVDGSPVGGDVVVTGGKVVFLSYLDRGLPVTLHVD